MAGCKNSRYFRCYYGRLIFKIQKLIKRSDKFELRFQKCRNQMAEEMGGYILETLGYPENDIELVKIAGYLHDIGNLINRVEHSQSGAVMAFRLLDKMGRML